jgi:5-methylcytosine-specific restriction endonuclease McrA
MKVVQAGELFVYIKDEIVGPRKGLNFIVAEHEDKRRMMFESIKDMSFIKIYPPNVYAYLNNKIEFKGFIFRKPTELEISAYNNIVTGEPFRRIAPCGFKVCGNIKCKQIKPITEFNKWSSSEDGLKNYCRECQNADSKKYHNENKELIHERAKEKYYKDVGRSRERGRKSALKRRDKIHETHRAWYEDNKEHKLKKNKKWYAENPERRRELGRRKARRRRERLAGFGHQFASGMEKIILTCFDGKCFNCGGTDRLCIDHHNPLSKGNALNIDNAVLLCIHCNSSKGDKLPGEFYAAGKIAEINEILKEAKRLWETNNDTI